ncbi:MAG TPA: tetraacyldisaccharide 4'-kinase [Chitinophagales bacterium]|nr:tetraacyldisaccharide 4'-kinase [Chitinophagales bacterium]
MRIITKILLFPFAVIYGAIIWLRNWLYKSNFIGSTDFEVPVISVGNLSVGGTGKTPFVALLIEILYGKYSAAVLSRGYKRSTKGYLEVNINHSAKDVGDEPLMLKLKYPHVQVSVGEQRVFAIPHLLASHHDTQVIVLDDAFQHQSVRPDINILLTTYEKPFYDDAILPIGTLRECSSGKQRANIIVVTKCPADLSITQQNLIRKKINIHQKQKLFFSTIEYGTAYNILQPNEKYNVAENKSHLLITGIANASHLRQYLEEKKVDVVHFEFSDHHYFEMHELEKIKQNYPTLCQWLTTEKDVVRLALHKEWFLQNEITLFCMPIRAKIIGENAADFQKDIIGFLDYFYAQENTSVVLND